MTQVVQEDCTHKNPFCVTLSHNEKENFLSFFPNFSRIFLDFFPNFSRFFSPFFAQFSLNFHSLFWPRSAQDCRHGLRYFRHSFRDALQAPLLLLVDRVLGAVLLGPDLRQ